MNKCAFTSSSSQLIVATRKDDDNAKAMSKEDSRKESASIDFEMERAYSPLSRFT